MKYYPSSAGFGTIVAMHQQAGGLALSATDLSNFLKCRFHTALDLTVALGLRKKPAVFENASAEALAQRGLEYEERYLESLRAQGRNVVSLAHIDFTERELALAETLRMPGASLSFSAAGF